MKNFYSETKDNIYAGAGEPGNGGRAVLNYAAPVSVEEALRESQKFVSSLLENAPHATIVINPDTSVRYVNPAWEEINGWTPGEIIGVKAPYPWWPEEERDIYSTNFKTAMTLAGNAEVISQKKGGEKYWIAINWTPVMRNGELQYLLINSVDITRQKEVEAKLQYQKQLIESILATMPEGVLVIDENDRIILANEAFHKIFHIGKRDTKNKPLHKILTIDRLYRLYHRVKQGKNHENTLEFRYRVKDLEKIINCVVI
jgi:PAS domain S-box-containing protein